MQSAAARIMLKRHRGIQQRLRSTNSSSSSCNGTSSPGESKRLQGKIALITGAANGIGAAAARLFVAHGAKVVIADVDDGRGYSLAAELTNTSSYNSSSSDKEQCAYVHCDVTQEADIEAAVHSTTTRYGRLDVMYCNAGVLGSSTNHAASGGGDSSISITQLDGAELDTVFALNVRGAALGIKHAARVMVKQVVTDTYHGFSPSILCTASISASRAGLGPHPYTMSKHALLGLVRSAACELAHHGVRVNCVSPNGVLTRFLDSEAARRLRPAAVAAAAAAAAASPPPLHDRDLQRMLSPGDVAAAALFLASDDSRYISGHNLVVDGSFSVSGAFNLFKNIRIAE